ncbi:MAG: response regulator, partial [Bacteroidota bacterium]|nr:response regulator [Bacteroidota bacterium]
MNCMIIDDDTLSRRIIEEFIQKTDGLELISSSGDPVEGINLLQKHDDIHLIFLDIEMPEMTGIELLHTLKNPPQVIIVSSKGKYAVDSYEYDVTDYLLKPVDYGRFFRAVSKA